MRAVWLALVMGCGGASSPGEERAPGAGAPGAQHGGELTDRGPVRVEVRLQEEGVAAWFTDAHGDPLDAGHLTAPSVMLRVDGARHELPLSVDGDPAQGAWRAALPMARGADVVGVLRFVDGGEGFAVDVRGRAGLAWHDHEPLYGGVVQMHGHHHVEFVDEGSRWVFYPSDAVRRALPGPVRGSVRSGDTEVTLAVDPATGALTAPAIDGDGEIEVSLSLRGEPVDVHFERGAADGAP